MACQSCARSSPAAAVFCMWCGTRLTTTAPQDNRRMATMVFADVAGSTRAAEHLEPEVVRRILGGFYTTAREVLSRYDGTVEKFIGDAVVAVFGVPIARPDDAVRAARAAWDLREAGQRMHQHAAEAYGVDVRLRIGVNTGEVVAGDVTTGSSFVSGDAVNVAARLEQAASPGEVLLSQLTADLAGHAFELGAPVELTVKGRLEKVRATPVLGWRADVEKTAFVGRGDLLSLLASAGSPPGGRLRLCGPPGIGRSRLLSEVAERSPRTVVSVSLGGKDLSAIRREVAEQVPLPTGSPAQLLAVLEDVTAGDASASEIDWAVTTLLRVEHQRRGVILLFDDEQSAAPGVTAWLTGLGELAGELGLLVTAWRTGDREPPDDGVHVHDLAPLDADESDVLVRRLGTQDEERRAEVVALAQGNPLFLVEACRLAGHDSPVPVGLRALMQARLDGLTGPEREVLAAAAVLGAEAAVSSVQALAPQPEAMGLVGHGMVEVVAGRVLFRQASMRDAVLAGLTMDRTAELHAAAASVLAARDTDPGAVGRHLALAARLRAQLRLDPAPTEAMAGRAVGHLLTAAAEATRTADWPHAGALVEEALSLGALVPDDAHLRGDLARWANRFGHFTAVTDLVPDDAPLPALKERGLALVRATDPGALARGREILALAGDLGDADALASLGGSWRSTDPGLAHHYYLAALELAPADPYPLGNALEHEIAVSGDLSPVQVRRTELVTAHAARRAQAERGEDLPWSWYDTARFALYLGLDGDAYSACAAGVLTSTADWMVLTSARSLQLAPADLKVGPWRDCLTLLDLSVSHDEPGAVVPPAVVLAGASGRQDDSWVRSFAPALATALPPAGVLVSGGTAQGASALAADVAALAPGWTCRGFLPGQLPTDVLPDARYDEMHRTAGTGFTVAEPLLGWRHLLSAGHDPADVRVLCLGGGPISTQEVHTGLALGARVAVVRPPDGRADPPGLDAAPWCTALRLQVLDGTSPALAAFLA